MNIPDNIIQAILTNYKYSDSNLPDEAIVLKELEWEFSLFVKCYTNQNIEEK